MRLLPLLRNGFLTLRQPSPRRVTCLRTLLEAWKNASARSHLGRRVLDKSGRVIIRGRMNLERIKNSSVWYKARKNSNLQLRLLAGVGEYLLGCANTMRELDGFGTIRQLEDHSKRQEFAKFATP